MDYRDLINKITLADCMDIMREMPDKCIDLAIVDPPYGIGDWTSNTSCYPQKNGTVLRVKNKKNKKNRMEQFYP